jgi:hypothetical protein
MTDAEQYMRSLLHPLAALGVGGSAILAAFVLRNGVAFSGEPLPDRYSPRPPRQCFFNARSMALRSKGLTYYEGFCASRDIGFPIHHAWVVNKGGHALDATLRDGSDYAYLGVPVPTRYLADPKKAWSGQFISAREAIHLDTLLQLDPGFQAVVEKLKVQGGLNVESE